MISSLAGSGSSSLRLQAEAALIAGLSYIGAVAAAISAASASALLHEAIIAAATGCAGGFIGLAAAALIRRMRRQTRRLGRYPGRRGARGLTDRSRRVYRCRERLHPGGQ